VILLAVGAGIATAASFAAKQSNCCQPAQVLGGGIIESAK